MSALAVALDFADLPSARALAERVGDHVDVLKIGLELFAAEGPRALTLRELGKPIFLDLKLHDIPETVERAIASAAKHGASMITVHASGGRAMLERAVARGAKEGVEILVVTLLTSLSAEDLADLGLGADRALAWAKLAHEAGARSFVCSPHEARALKQALGDIRVITPGIRLDALGRDERGDQKRVATPEAAVAAGADLLVVGRPIRDAADPAAAASDIARRMRA